MVSTFQEYSRHLKLVATLQDSTDKRNTSITVESSVG